MLLKMGIEMYGKIDQNDRIGIGGPIDNDSRCSYGEQLTTHCSGNNSTTKQCRQNVMANQRQLALTSTQKNKSVIDHQNNNKSMSQMSKRRQCHNYWYWCSENVLNVNLKVPSVRHLSKVITILVVVICLTAPCVSSQSEDRDKRSPSNNPPDSRNHQKVDESFPSQRPSSCSGCMLREELRTLNLEYIKSQVLKKLGFQENNAPNVTGRMLPKISAERMREIMDKAREDTNINLMLGDDPNPGFKEGPMVTEEEDDFHARTEKVISIAQPFPRLRHNWKGHDILQFTFSEKIMRHRVKKATLHVYVKGAEAMKRKKRSIKRQKTNKTDLKNSDDATNVDQQENNEEIGRREKRTIESAKNIEYDYNSSDLTTSGSLEYYKVTVYKVYRNPKNSEVPSFEYVESETFPQPGGAGKWIRLDVSTMLSEWFKTPRENLGFVIKGNDKDGNKIVITDVSEDDAKTPFVEVYTVEAGNRRMKRSIGLTCTDTSEEPRCCRYPLTVDFQEFGWDWVIAPKKYDANYCSGDCPYVFLQKYPHTHIVSLAAPSQQACCTPRKMSPISMLYFDQDYNIIYGMLPNMVVDRCGCS